MKKVYTTPEYKYRHKQRGLKIQKRLRKSDVPSKKKIVKPAKEHERFSVIEKPTVIAPPDFRLLDKPENVVSFFRDIRSNEFMSHKRSIRYVTMTLRYITKIDYAAISILTALNEDLKSKRILLRGDLPDNPECRQFMIDSGYLDNLFDALTKSKFQAAPTSEMIFFEKGAGRLSDSENRKISELIKKVVVNHLNGQDEHCQKVRTIILEICGNSIEWSGTENKQWLLGVKYDPDKVTFTVSDVGKGILDTLYRRHLTKVTEYFMGKRNDTILKGAFNQKYGSSTLEINRGTGLPSVKESFDQGIIQSLKVITNNVILHFDKDAESREFKSGSDRFKGTFYQWEITKDCLNKIVIE